MTTVAGNGLPGRGERERMDTAATLVVGAVALYAATGLAVGTAFIVFGIDRVLEPPADVSLGARVLILPGAAALWPYVLKRWASSGRGS